MGDRQTRPGHRAGARRAESAHLPSARPAGSVRSPGRHAEAAPGPGPARQGQRTVLNGHVQGTAPRSRAHSATWTGGAPIETCGPARKAGASGLGESQGKARRSPASGAALPAGPPLLPSARCALVAVAFPGVLASGPTSAPPPPSPGLEPLRCALGAHDHCRPISWRRPPWRFTGGAFISRWPPPTRKCKPYTILIFSFLKIVNFSIRVDGQYYLSSRCTQHSG